MSSDMKSVSDLKKPSEITTLHQMRTEESDIGQLDTSYFAHYLFIITFIIIITLTASFVYCTTFSFCVYLIRLLFLDKKPFTTETDYP